MQLKRGLILSLLRGPLSRGRGRCRLGLEPPGALARSSVNVDRRDITQLSRIRAWPLEAGGAATQKCVRRVFHGSAIADYHESPIRRSAPEGALKGVESC